VQPGPASQSYGLQVAQLAGVPQPVIRAARKHLATLEAHSIQSTRQFDLFATGTADAGQAEEQLDKTAADETNAAVTDALAGIDPDALSPREALEALYRLKRLLDQRAIQ
jgi:DNA mismatch repair protein MutS